MIATARDALRERLDPRLFNEIRLAWWTTRHYLPRLGASFFAPRFAQVEGFPQGRSQTLVDQIRKINLAAPTPLCRIMTRFGSDKGRDWHNYTTVYSALFSGLRGRPLRIFELGLGTTNAEFSFHMGPNGRPGASLRGWRDWFPGAQIYGADIDRDVLFEENGIRTFYCDQLDPAVIEGLWSQPELRDGADIILDDGLHTFEGNRSFLEGSLRHLRPGGCYVVEDVEGSTLGKWRSALEAYAETFPNYQIALAELPNPHNTYDNNLVVIQRPE